MGIHPIGQTDESLESRSEEVLLCVHRPNDTGERLEITPLYHQGIRFEERNDDLNEISPPFHRVRQHSALWSLWTHRTTSEEPSQCFENAPMVLMLVHVEHWLQLPPSMSVHHRVAMHRYREAPFAIHKTNDPSRIEQRAWPGSFLLIVRTGRIVTVHAASLQRRCDTNEYRRILGYSSI
jgi:hypothetical protein